MTHKEAAEWLDQIETSLTRAELGKKDIDIIVLLRLAYKIIQEKEKELRNE